MTFWNRRNWSGDVVAIEAVEVIKAAVPIETRSGGIELFASVSTRHGLRFVRQSDLTETGDVQTQTLSKASAGRLDAECWRDRDRSASRKDDVHADQQRDRHTDLPARSDSSATVVRPPEHKRAVVPGRPQTILTRDPATGSAGPLLIDFNNLLVRAWFAGKPSESHAVRSMFQTVASSVRAVRPSRIVFCLDGGHAHRAALLPSYKAHRPPSDPDLVRQRQLAIDAIETAGLQMIRVDGYEADDVIASLARREQSTIILSSDKDLLSLGGVARVYHPWGEGAWKTAEDVLGIPAGQVADYLALCGDTSDGVPGVSGIGPKTAVTLLQQHGSLEAILAAARTLRIPGASGQKLRDGTAAALLSHKLVSLVDTLAVPELHPWTPRDGWQSRLTAMRLRAVAAILDSLTTLSQPTALAAGSSPSPSPPPCSIPEPLSEIIEHVLHRSITEPIRPPMGVSELWDGPDRGLIGCWERGRQHGGRDNPWRKGTDNHLAWQQGQMGRDLHIPQHSAVASGPATPAGSIAASDVAKSRGARARSLFDTEAA